MGFIEDRVKDYEELVKKVLVCFKPLGKKKVIKLMEELDFED